MEREKLADVLKQILQTKRNTKARNAFMAAIGNFKPASCAVKIGWKSGAAISFDCVFEKNGNGDVFEEIEKGIENSNEIVYFIYGLNPKVFYYNPQFTYDELKPDKFFISFKLKRDAKVK